MRAFRFAYLGAHPGARRTRSLLCASPLRSRRSTSRKSRLTPQVRTKLHAPPKPGQGFLSGITVARKACDRHGLPPAAQGAADLRPLPPSPDCWCCPRHLAPAPHRPSVLRPEACPMHLNRSQECRSRWRRPGSSPPRCSPPAPLARLPSPESSPRPPPASPSRRERLRSWRCGRCVRRLVVGASHQRPARPMHARIGSARRARQALCVALSRAAWLTLSTELCPLPRGPGSRRRHRTARPHQGATTTSKQVHHSALRLPLHQPVSPRYVHEVLLQADTRNRVRMWNLHRCPRRARLNMRIVRRATDALHDRLRTCKKVLLEIWLPSRRPFEWPPTAVPCSACRAPGRSPLATH